ncbi:transposase [Rhodopila globiformis]
MSNGRPRSFTRDFKLSALKRMAETDSVRGLAAELGIERTLLYRWRPSPWRSRTRGAAADRSVGAEDRRTASGAGFFSRSLAACQGASAADQRAWRDGVYAMIQASIQQQGVVGIEPLCALAGLARSGYYRHWAASAPRQEETALRDAIQLLSLADRKLGYRPITVLLKREV